jgi:hypothetical protein
MIKPPSQSTRLKTKDLSIPVNPSPDRVCKTNRHKSPSKNVVKRLTQDIQRRKYVKAMNQALSSIQLKKSTKKTNVFDRLLKDTNKRTERKVKLHDYLLSQTHLSPKPSYEDSKVYERLFKDSEIRKERANMTESLSKFRVEKITEKTLTNGIFQRILESSQETLRRSIMNKAHKNLLTVPSGERKKIISVLKCTEGSICDEATKDPFNEDEFIEKTYGLKLT